MVVSTPDIHFTPQPCFECETPESGGIEFAVFPAGEFTVGLVEQEGLIVALAECPEGHRSTVPEADINKFPALRGLVEDLMYLGSFKEARLKASLIEQHKQRYGSVADANPHPRHPSN
jgi:hypothetical protein